MSGTELKIIFLPEISGRAGEAYCLAEMRDGVPTDVTRYVLFFASMTAIAVIFMAYMT